MALALALLLEPASERAVQRVWKAMAARSICRRMLDLTYPPHLTLLLNEDESQQEALCAFVANVDAPAQMPLRLGTVERFPGTSVCWIACDGGVPLRRFHEQACAALPGQSISPYYRPDAWVPHVTVQMSGDSEAGLSLARGVWPGPIDTFAIRMEVARFLPVQRLAGRDLKI